MKWNHFDFMGWFQSNWQRVKSRRDILSFLVGSHLWSENPGEIKFLFISLICLLYWLALALAITFLCHYEDSEHFCVSDYFHLNTVFPASLPNNLILWGAISSHKGTSCSLDWVGEVFHQGWLHSSHECLPPVQRSAAFSVKAASLSLETSASWRSIKTGKRK